MIEAQALYTNTLISKVRAAKANGGSIAIAPKPEVVAAYNAEIQARLNVSAFADPNCNSWYKNEAGLITNNWSDAVIPYQKRTCELNWGDYDVKGEGREECVSNGKEKWGLIVEETQVSNGTIVGGLITAAAAVVAGTIYRKSLRQLLK